MGSKKSHRPKKLKVRRETVRPLSDSSLEKVRGGDDKPPPPTTSNVMCASAPNCWKPTGS